MPQAARSTLAEVEPARAGGEFFAWPSNPNHRRYEALRAYLFEGSSAADAARRAGWSVATLRSAVRDFRAGKTGFFATPRPGPTTAPAKDAARPTIIQLRQQGLSAIESSEALAGTPTPLNRTGVAEVLREEGFARMWPRPLAARGGGGRTDPPRARLLDFADLPPRCETKVAGLLLAVPELVSLGLPAMVATAAYPCTAMIPATSYVLSLLALKLVGMRRVSHVDDLAADTGAGLFASLVALPKATALSTYSYRLSHARQVAFLRALGQAMLQADLVADRGGDLDLDFHAIMHWGEDVALERHYVPARSQRTRSVLSFFAQDHATHTLVYANADLTSDRQAQEVLVFSDHWKALTGWFPQLLVMDQKVTTHKVLDEQDTVTDYPQTIRQLVVQGLGREAPTVIITNNRRASAKMVIERYAGRMTVEQRLAESIRSFHLDALCSAVPLNVDLDVVLSVLAGAVCASLRRRLTGYQAATPDTLQRRFLSTGGVIIKQADTIVVRLKRRTYSPVLRQADIPEVAVPWWHGRRLRFEFD